MQEEIKLLPLRQVFWGAYQYMQSNQKTMRLFWVANLVFLVAFKFIENGFSNPWSMLWLLGYYIFWCGFFRVYYDKKPYFWTKKVVSSMVPSTKVIFLTFIFLFLLAVLPYLPLLMGFNDQYLLFFEKYMEMLENAQNARANLLNVAVFSAVFLVVSPLIFCRPFFAFIAALQGLNGSMHKAFYKTRHNYGRFLAVMTFLNLPWLAAYELDAYFEMHDWFVIGFSSFFLVYYYLVFAKMYDFFYHDDPVKK